MTGIKNGFGRSLLSAMAGAPVANDLQSGPVFDPARDEFVLPQPVMGQPAQRRSALPAQLEPNDFPII